MTGKIQSTLNLLQRSKKIKALLTIVSNSPVKSVMVSNKALSPKNREEFAIGSSTVYMLYFDSLELNLLKDRGVSVNQSIII